MGWKMLVRGGGFEDRWFGVVYAIVLRWDYGYDYEYGGGGVVFVLVS